MSALGWLQTLAAASAVAVAVLALLERGRSPFRTPLTLLAVNQFAWNATMAGGDFSQAEGAAWVGVAAAPMFTPVAFHYVLTFVGKRQRLSRWLWATYGVFGAQTVLATVDAASAFDLPGGFHTYAAMMLIASTPVAIAGCTLAYRHLREAVSDAERFRSKLLIAALASVLLLFVTDLLADLGLPVPRLATFGSFVFNVLLVQISLGFTPLSGRAGVVRSLVVGLFIVVAYLTLFFTLGHRLGVLVVAMAALSALLLGVGALAWRALRSERDSLERFATMGRFSAQMAHDLKNPLAAAKGAAEFLSEELKRAGLFEQRSFAELIVQQLDRLTTIINRYQRLSNFELTLRPLEVNALVVQVLSLQQFATGGAAVSLKENLADGLPVIEADAQLLGSALENVVKNAFEAGATNVTVSTHTGPGTVVLSVSDDGRGMNARTKEQAFTLFYTTKTTGSGLGLAFVQQIVRAHRGKVVLTSAEGEGTTVALHLPTG